MSSIAFVSSCALLVYPNVLALDYMKRTKKLHAKAEGFSATSYQRLLTFEGPGGGFSWFGNAANKILTAIKIATRNGAEFLGRLDSIGTLAPGEPAAMVLINGNSTWAPASDAK
jgi:hypothetical protein